MAPHDDEEALTTQHLKNIKLGIEYKYLIKHAPSGVVVLPSLDDLRSFHGAIFVKRGLYRDGVFRFTMTLPPAYNDVDTHPRIVFTPPIYHPLVDPAMGTLDLRVDPALRDWVPGRHFLVTALLFVKKIFYFKSYDAFAAATLPNDDARTLFDTAPQAFEARAQQAVQESLHRVHEAQPPEVTLQFHAPIPAHHDLKESILLRSHTNAANDRTSDENDDTVGDDSRNVSDSNIDVSSLTRLPAGGPRFSTDLL
jgi:ubiquitin-protein ligase